MEYVIDNMIDWLGWIVSVVLFFFLVFQIRKDGEKIRLLKFANQEFAALGGYKYPQVRKRRDCIIVSYYDDANFTTKEHVYDILRNGSFKKRT